MGPKTKRCETDVVLVQVRQLLWSKTSNGRIGGSKRAVDGGEDRETST